MCSFAVHRASLDSHTVGRTAVLRGGPAADPKRPDPLGVHARHGRALALWAGFDHEMPHRLAIDPHIARRHVEAAQLPVEDRRGRQSFESDARSWRSSHWRRTPKALTAFAGHPRRARDGEAKPVRGGKAVIAQPWRRGHESYLRASCRRARRPMSRRTPRTCGARCDEHTHRQAEPPLHCRSPSHVHRPRRTRNGSRCQQSWRASDWHRVAVLPRNSTAPSGEVVVPSPVCPSGWTPHGRCSRAHRHPQSIAASTSLFVPMARTASRSFDAILRTWARGRRSRTTPRASFRAKSMLVRLHETPFRGSLPYSRAPTDRASSGVWRSHRATGTAVPRWSRDLGRRRRRVR